MSIVRVSPLMLVVPAWLTVGDTALAALMGCATGVLALLAARQVLFRVRANAARADDGESPQ
jgi:hypothetical protein